MHDTTRAVALVALLTATPLLADEPAAPAGPCAKWQLQKVRPGDSEPSVVERFGDALGAIADGRRCTSVPKGTLCIKSDADVVEAIEFETTSKEILYSTLMLALREQWGKPRDERMVDLPSPFVGSVDMWVSPHCRVVAFVQRTIDVRDDSEQIQVIVQRQGVAEKEAKGPKDAAADALFGE